MVFSRRQYLSGMVATSILIAGCTSDSESGSGSETTDSGSTGAAAKALDTWIEDHKDLDESAEEVFDKAFDLYEDGEYGRALVKFENVKEDYDNLKSDAEERMNSSNPSESAGKLYRAIYRFYYNMSEAAAAGYLASSAMNKGNSGEADDYYTRLQERYDKALEQLDEIERLGNG